MTSDPVRVELQSRNLHLTPIRAEHRQALAELHNDALVRAAIFEGKPQDEADIERSLSLFLKQWREEGIGFWMVYERTHTERNGAAAGLDGRAIDAAGTAAQLKPEAMIGRAGLRHCEFRDALEFGYVLKGSAAGRGLGPEAARLVIAHGIACLRPAHILGFIAPGNQRALSAALSLGFCMTGEVWREGRSWLALELDQTRFAAALKR